VAIERRGHSTQLELKRERLRANVESTSGPTDEKTVDVNSFSSSSPLFSNDLYLD